MIGYQLKVTHVTPTNYKASLILNGVWLEDNY